ncbi:hypothetical protein Aph01nite_46860 [Acrocarpospora phusangensis]|uniref:HTH cro/C1-type domain-containing protein n=1 Tax=Acrocarpospora phusangensis TaxID=1070424 RepID=A0A919QEB4_9ACTN|nr:helix-turn-helix transcriptional regulator [Acrocarpospora phusangensis]GIH26376.1 hypothetical protein Aph01nite_46860 [Acrocarpospora phusangensis]
MAIDEFGPELRRRREAAGLSLSQLAAAVPCHKGTLSKIESGKARPGEGVAARCDEILRAGGMLVAVARADRTRAKMAAGYDTAARAPARVPGPRYPPEILLPSLEEVIRGLRSMGRRLAAAAVLPMVSTEFELLAEMGDIGALPAYYAEYASWLAQESGRPGLALSWLKETIRLADLFGDRDLSAYATVRRAELMLAHDHLGAAELAARVRRRPGLSRRVLALAAHTEAYGRALYGDERACEAALAEATGFLAAAPETGLIGPTTVGDLGSAARGWCLYDLGRAAESAPLLEGALATVHPEGLRAQGLLTARLARAYLRAGRLASAHQATHDALGLVGRTRSAGAYAELRELSGELAGWSRNVLARGLRAEIAAAMRGLPLAG